MYYRMNKTDDFVSLTIFPSEIFSKSVFVDALNYFWKDLEPQKFKAQCIFATKGYVSCSECLTTDNFRDLSNLIADCAYQTVQWLEIGVIYFRLVFGHDDSSLISENSLMALRYMCQDFGVSYPSFAIVDSMSDLLGYHMWEFRKKYVPLTKIKTDGNVIVFSELRI